MTAPASETLQSRTALDPQFTWDLERLYREEDEFDRDFARVDSLARELASRQGKLTTPELVADFFAKQDECDRVSEKIYTFSSHRADEDTANTLNQARKNRVRARLTEISAELAWVRPELLSLPEATLKAWCAAPALAPYRRTFELLLRDKPHTLSAPEEKLISAAGEVLSAPYEIYNLFHNADLKFGPVKDAQGESHELTSGRYVKFLHKTDRTLRRNAFEGLYSVYGGFSNTFAGALSAGVKADNYVAKSRNFPNALEAALHPDALPVAVYDSLVAAVRKALPHFHDYLSLRRSQLKLDALDMYDMYVPIVPEYKLEIPYGQAVEWVREAMRPMGAEYMKAVDACFAERWVDVYENVGKKPGAYSGGCFDSPPFMLLNYQGTLDDVFTLAHELGHSIHTWMSNKAQPYRYSRYTIFVAEIASTTAEALLHHHLVSTAKDAKMKAALLNHLCDGFKGTVYRQTMFAEFDRILHEADAAGTPLTADWIAESYYKLNATYYGPDVKADERIGLEWCRIAHFYYNFYVFKYATGFCAAQVFAQNILAGGASREAYLEMLKSGGSADPLEQVRKGGVDLSTPAVVERAFSTFAGAVKELGAALKDLR